MAPRRVFAKYLKNDLADLHETLRPLYRSSFKNEKFEYRSFIVAMVTN